MKQIALFGYSGHAFVIADAIQLMGYDLVGYYDRAEAAVNPFDLTYLGDEKDDVALSKISESEASFFVSIGDNLMRKRVAQMLNLRGVSGTATVIHPASVVSTLATIGEGSFIAAGAMINPMAAIGVGAIINTGAIIEHECHVGAFSHIAPGAVLTGNVSIGEGSFIGANSVVKQGIRIGANAIVGAGAVVIRDVPDNQTWAGNPAKRIK